VVLIRGNLEKCIFIIHNFYWFFHYFRAEIKIRYNRLCLLKTSYPLPCYFLKPLFCFHILPYYVSLSCSNNWIIDKLDTQRNGFSDYILNGTRFAKKKCFDIFPLQKWTLTESKYAAASLSYLSQLHVHAIYAYLPRKNSAILGSCYVKFK